MSSIDQKKIAKNTLMLYMRMGLMMIVSFYTSRVILDNLGEVDFGIYNAVGGIVALFSFISGTMSTACQRFFLVELGKGDSVALRKVFSLCLFAFALFAIVIVLVSEPVGLWFLNNKMQLAGREQAAGWVFQFSIISFIAAVVRLPFMGMVIARERMDVYAFISVFEVLASLGVALLLDASHADRLIFYSFLMLAVQLVLTALYVIYCLSKYCECRWMSYWDASGFKEIFSFAGWNMIGSSAGIMKVHGANLLLNMFFGPAVNAARGIAFKVYSAVSQLQDSFMTASKPQIIKSYSVGDIEGMSKLVYQAAKFSVYLMLFVSVPLILEMPFLLSVWLKEVPEFSALFASLMLVNIIVDNLDYTLWVAIQATGKVRNYQLVVGSVQLLVLPVAYALYKWASFPPETVFVVSIAVSVLAMVFRIGFAKSLVGLRAFDFIGKVLLPVAVSTAVPVLVGLLVREVMDEGLLRFLAVGSACVLAESLAIWFLGLSSGEKNTILSKIRSFL